MSVVVSDTSPLRGLAHLELLHLLAALFDEVFIPPAVLYELESHRPSFQPIYLANLLGVRVLAPTDIAKVAEFRGKYRLDAGESEALALAIQIAAAEVLMDEAAGRRRAKELGIAPVGLLAILVRAKKTGLIVAVVPLMRRLKDELNFFISKDLWDAVVRQVNE